MFPPGSKILYFLTSDSDSSSKTVYMASWASKKIEKITNGLRKQIYNYVSFCYFSSPGSTISRVSTSDSDSSSKTVYMASWAGLETENPLKLIKNNMLETTFKENVLCSFKEGGPYTPPSWPYIQFLMRNPNLKSKITGERLQRGKRGKT